MSFFELMSAEAMLGKAKREFERLREEPSIDHVYNFFVTAYHIVDYLEQRLSKEAIKTIRAIPVIQFCGDVCNKAKHMTLSRGRSDVATQSFSDAINGVPLNAIAINAPGERWVRWQDGTQLEVVIFATNVIATWEQLFTDYGITSPLKDE